METPGLILRMSEDMETTSRHGLAASHVGSGGSQPLLGASIYMKSPSAPWVGLMAHIENSANYMKTALIAVHEAPLHIEAPDNYMKCPGLHIKDSAVYMKLWDLD